ncbi:MAG: hypothetical protein Q4B54_07695, partial [Coriobacteriales bacterium]|nr:hypothetical protein [Coriobacteriales bacterium]
DPASLPQNSLLKLNSNLYTCCPELTFVQMANVTSQLGLIVLGYELCGSYAHFSQLISGFYDRKPLTSTANIGHYLDELHRMRGLLKARSALQWVRDGSRSPMETVVSCMLFLPGYMGGWGRATPALNHVVKLDKAASRITRTKTAKVDLSWPELMIGIEYDSKTFHQNPDKDRKRREALTHMGWAIYVINLDEIKSYPSLEAKVELFIDQIPCGPHTQAASKQERRQLLDRLLTATRFGLGLNNALFGLPVEPGTITTHL